MTHTVAYLRVSTDKQADSGAGLDAQLDACQRIGDLASVHRDEGVSGTLPLHKRAGLMDAIAELDKGSLLIVAKRDRLGREPMGLAMIEAAVARKGARIVSAAGEGTDDDEPSSILMRRMVDAFGEYERLLIGARTSAALQAKRARGERAGHVPFGKMLDEDAVHLVDCQQEQDILAMIAELRGRGLSLRKIAAELNERGICNRGRRWNHVTVQTKLRHAA